VEKGSHAHRGMTDRNKIMFGAGGFAYVYLCYGIHNMFNVVTNVEGKADAVLIRALEPQQGEKNMLRRMGTTRPARISSGPGKLAKAMALTGRSMGNTSEVMMFG